MLNFLHVNNFIYNLAARSAALYGRSHAQKSGGFPPHQIAVRWREVIWNFGAQRKNYK